MSMYIHDKNCITAPKFESVFNNNGQFFRLLQDNFHPPEYVDGLISEIYKEHGFVTYIVDDALIRYMKQSFKRLKEGRRDKFPNYKIIGLSKSGFTPFDVPKAKVSGISEYLAAVQSSPVVCGSTQMKRPMVLNALINFKNKRNTGPLLFFLAYSDDALTEFAQQQDLPMALMAADISAPMSRYFGEWYDWYYLRCSRQDKVVSALVNSRTYDLHIPEPYKAGVDNHLFFERCNAVEDYIAENTSLTSGQARNANVKPDFNADLEILVGKDWQTVHAIDLNWGGMGRGREDSFGLATTDLDYGQTVVLRIKTDVKDVYFCGIFMKAGMRGNKYVYTPLPVKNKDTLQQINALSNTSFE